MKKALSLLLIALLTLTVLSSCKKKQDDSDPATTEAEDSVSVEGEVKIIETPLSKTLNYYIGVKKSNGELLQKINEFIAGAKGDGSLDQIISNHFCDKEATVIVSAEEAEGKNQLIVATDARNPSFEKKEGDGFTGIDMELAKALADHLGKELVIHDVNPDSFGDILENGDADVVISCLTNSAELKEKMSFSELYYSATQVVIVTADDDRFDACTSSEEIENIIKEFPASKRIGVQKYSVAQYYVIGDEERNYAGIQAECVPYPNCKYAVENLMIGDVDCVITDESAAQPVLNSFQ